MSEKCWFEKILFQKFFGTNKIFGLKILNLEKKFGSGKKLGVNKNLGQNKFWVGKIISKKIVGKKKF